MPSTTVHIPDEVLNRIDSIAARRGVSRNRVVNEALEAAIDRDAGQWPEGFFDGPSDPEDRRILAEAAEELERVVVAGRRSRGAPLL